MCVWVFVIGCCKTVCPYWFFYDFCNAHAHARVGANGCWQLHRGRIPKRDQKMHVHPPAARPFLIVHTLVRVPALAFAASRCAGNIVSAVAINMFVFCFCPSRPDPDESVDGKNNKGAGVNEVPALRWWLPKVCPRGATRLSKTQATSKERQVDDIKNQLEYPTSQNQQPRV